jgi:SAM-dependent methyltransferase
MTDAPVYALPRIVTRAQDCDFYHTLELPGHGLVHGAWDLRRGLDRYLGHARFDGKRVLDVGTATGCLTFYMEQQGAQVVSYDLCPGLSWDVVPYAGNDMDQVYRQVRVNVSRFNDGYWFCHRALGSKAWMVYGSVYDIPETIGPVDMAVCGSILLHLRDPFLALENACRLARETVIVADMVPRRRVLPWLAARVLGTTGTGLLGKRMKLLPNASDFPRRDCLWWELPPALICQLLGVLGFEDARVNFHTQFFQGSRRLMFTVVARRTRPAAMATPIAPAGAWKASSLRQAAS